MHKIFSILTFTFCSLFSTAYASPLNIEKISSNADNNTENCLIFNKDLEKSPVLSELKNYLKLYDGPNEVDFNHSIMSNQICLYNLKYGHHYKVILAPNFISSDGSKNTTAIEKNFVTSNAESSISLAKGSILSLQNQESLKITTCNIDEIELHLYRISAHDLHDNNLYSYIQNQNLENYKVRKLIKNNAVFLGKKQLFLPKRLNENINSVVNFKELGAKDNYGIYLLLATKPNTDFNDPFFNDNDLYLSRLIMISNIGISAYKGDDGLTIALRSLKTAEPYNGIKVSLIASNNEILATENSNKYGYVHFSHELLEGKGGHAPMAVLADDEDDSLILDLRQNKLYIENSGREKKNSLYEIFAYVDRDLLNPGDTLNFNALLRDHNLKAVKAKALIFKLSNPYGAVIEQKILKNQGAASFSTSFKFDQCLPEGIYTLSLSLDGQNELYRKEISVFKFKPQVFSMKVIDNVHNFKAGQAGSINLNYTFNYGSPVSNAVTDGFMRTAADNYPFDALKNFYFGPDTTTHQGYNTIPLGNFTSDKNGNTQISFNLDESPYPLSLYLDLNANDTLGNTNFKTLKYKINASNNIVGVKRLDAENFAITQTNPSGKFIKGDIDYRLFKLRTTWQYAYENGSWRYTPVEIRIPVNSGKITLTTEQLDKSALKMDLEDGCYCLELDNHKSLTSLRFYKGYFNPDNTSKPEQFSVSLDKKTYIPGQEAKLSFDLPFDGYADLVLGTNKLSSINHYKVKKGKNEISIHIDESMGTGTHALISVYTQEQATRPSIRTLGLVYIPVKIENSALKIEAEIPDNLKPNDTLEIPLTITGGEGKTYYTAALVDDGILGLTNFKAPDPLTYLNSAKLFSLDVYDLYGYLINTATDLKQGYGADSLNLSANKNNAPISVREKLINLYQGITELKDGKGLIKFKLPKRQSGAKLMIVAWNDTALGSFNYDLKIHDKVSVHAAIPLYAYTQDEIETNLALINLEDKKNTYKLSLICEGALKCKELKDLTLENLNDKKQLNFKIEAVNSGSGLIKLNIQGDNYNFNDKYSIDVLKPDLQFLSFNFSDKKEEINIFKKDYIDITKNRSSVPNLISESLLLKTLDEEIISSEDAFYTLNTLLCIKEADSVLYAKHQKAIDTKINYGIKLLTSLIDLRGYLNDFYDNRLSLDVAYLLRRAVSNGFKVNAETLKCGEALIVNTSQSYNPVLATTALKYRALNGENVLAQSRYLFDTQIEPNVESMAQFAHIFTILGDKERALSAINKGIDQLKTFSKLMQIKKYDDASRFTSKAKLDALNLIGAYLRIDSYENMPEYLKESLKTNIQGPLSPKTISLYLDISAKAQNTDNYQSVITYGKAYKSLKSSDNISFKRQYLNDKGENIKWQELKAGDLITVVETIKFTGKAPLDLTKISTIPANLSLITDIPFTEKFDNLKSPYKSYIKNNNLKYEHYRYFDNEITSAYRYLVLYNGSFKEANTIIYDENNPVFINCD